MQGRPDQFDWIIWGGYGWGNTGDEICLAAALDRLQAKAPGGLAVLSHNPEYTSRLFPNVEVLPCLPAGRGFSKRCKNFARHLSNAFASLRRHGTARGFTLPFQPDWAHHLSRARHLYLCGGGYLTDHLSMDVVLPPILQAARMGMSIATAPIGIGPFKSGGNARRVARALAHAEVKVRDEASRAFCRSHGLHATLERDAAFAWARLVPPATSVEFARPRPRKLGLCFFSQYGEGTNYDFSGWWTKCLRGLRARHPDAEIEGFSFHASPEYEFREMARIFAGAGLSVHNVRPPEVDFRKAAAALRSYDFIVSARFHAIVLANAFQIPNIAIAAGDYYLPKMRAAIGGYQSISRLVNPAVQPPETLVASCNLTSPPAAMHLKRRSLPASRSARPQPAGWSGRI